MLRVERPGRGDAALEQFRHDRSGIAFVRQLDTDEQAGAAHRGDRFRPARCDRARAGHEFRAAFARVAGEILVDEHVDRRQCRRAREFVPAEGRRVHQRRLRVGRIPNRCARDGRADRNDAAGQAFGQRHDVGNDAGSTSHANRLPQRPSPVCTSSAINNAPRVVAAVARAAQIARRRNIDAAFGLDRFDDERRRVRQFRRQRAQIAERHVDDIGEQRRIGETVIVAAAGGQRTEGLAVKRVVRGDDLRCAWSPRARV